MSKEEPVALVRVQDLTDLINQIKEMKEMLSQFLDSTKTKAVSINKAAELLGVHYNSVRKMIIRGDLKSQRLNGETGKQVVLMSSIEEFIAKR